MLKWIQLVWKYHAFFTFKQPTLLVLDESTSNKIIEVMQVLKSIDTTIPKIPGELTWKLHPLDVCINKLFKDLLKKRYFKYCMEISNLKVKREDLITQIDEIWNSDSITLETISKSFLGSGVANKMDG